MSLLRTLLRFDPCLPRGWVRLAPALPAELGEVSISRLSLAGRHVRIRAAGSRGDISGLPASVQVVQAEPPD